MAMTSDALFMSGRQGGKFSGTDSACHQIKTDCQHSLSSLHDKNVVPSQEGTSATLCYDRNCFVEKVSDDAPCNSLNIEADTRNNGGNNGCLGVSGAVEFSICHMNLNGHATHDLYHHKHDGDDDDEEDDSDWEPIKHLVIRKWFCRNCTMANFDDVFHCDVCGEYKESEVFVHELFKCSFSDGKWSSIKTEALQKFQGQ